MSQVTLILDAIQHGDSKAAEELAPSSHEEIARVLSVNEKTVRRHWEVAKVRLFQLVKAAQ